MQSQEIRRKFLGFFKDKQHAVISSSSVVPHEDPTLLFINAGMNQFKDVFLGKNKRDYVRATTAQKCIRVGGKHNDLDNVGHTTRHLTFFEMLGNFSFGDYFKKEAIEYAWEVSTQIFNLPPEQIWITVFQEDDEAFELWRTIVPESRIVRMGEKDNFWAMGDTGPCGPCSELLFDRGNRYGNARSPLEDAAGERFFEFWNLVFMQFNRDAQGKFHSLPQQSIDTGSGLERVVSLQMGVNSVFETDIFRELIAQIENVLSLNYDITDPKTAPAFHVISDHIRSLAFAIADGAQPSNVERGYVLRKILRRAVRYGRSLGVQQPFLAKILPRLIDVMGNDYPELRTTESRAAEILTLEEESFLRTLKRGGTILNQVIEKAEKTPLKQIEGADAFKLKDTYGLPLEEILLIAKDYGLQVNLESYQILEELAKEKSRAADAKVHQEGHTSLFENFGKTHGKCAFLGYGTQEMEGTILALLKDGHFVDSLSEGQEGSVILDKTSFYAEKGGQVGDTGSLLHQDAEFSVVECSTPYPDVILHTGVLKRGTLLLGEPVVASIHKERRQKIANNHTATHLLHAALQKILGHHIRQAGSLVEPNRLRFDFNHHKAISSEELVEIERWVNARIRENTPVNSYELSYEEAQQNKEIKQFFGEKYGSKVRVIDIQYSKELCGGTHTSHVGTIGLFRIVKEGSIAAGIRRIEALTGEEAEEALCTQTLILNSCCERLKTSPSMLIEKLDELLLEHKTKTGEIRAFRRNLIKSQAENLLSSAPTIQGALFIDKIVSLDPQELQTLSEDLSQIKGPYLFILATCQPQKCQLLVKVSSQLQEKGLLASAIIKEISPCIQGGGGGKGDLAQAGGKNPDGITEAFARAKRMLEAIC